LLFDRKTIAALNSGEKPPVAQPGHSDAAVFAMAAHLLGSHYGIPIVHDITNWLRVGDITFLRWVSDESNEWFFRTVEVKSSLANSVTDADGSVSATVMVDLYSNEPLALPEVDRKASPETGGLTSRLPNTAERPTREDRRIRGQFVRLDNMVLRRDLATDAVTIVEGMANVVLMVDHSPTHRWADLRRAIRDARRHGYSFFDIDGFIGYGLAYNESGVSVDDLLKPQIRNDVRDRLLGGGAAMRGQGSLIVQQIPLLERHDAQGAPVMRFFNYSIPKRAKADLIRNRLLITAVVNMGRLTPALVERGLGVEPADSDLAGRGYPYTANLVWPDGQTDCLGIPTTAVSGHVKVAVNEFLGLAYVADHVASVTQLPDVISREEWLNALGETLHET
jgi:hypothetical protein